MRIDPSFSMDKLKEFARDDPDFDIEVQLDTLKERYGFAELSSENAALLRYGYDVALMGFDLADRVNDMELECSSMCFRNRMRIIFTYIREIQHGWTDSDK